MENIVYQRDYSRNEKKQAVQPQKEIPSKILEYVAASGRTEDAYLRMPRVINENRKAAYDRFLSALDRMTRALGGKIEGVVDYQNWEATIFIVQDFVEFSTAEDMELLKDIAANSQTVTLTATPDGKVKMKLLIDYFDIVGEIENHLEEDIANCPELAAMLEEADRTQKQTLMSEPMIAVMVQIGAESSGVTEEEYLDRLVAFLRNPPDDFVQSMQKWIDDHS